MEDQDTNLSLTANEINKQIVKKDWEYEPFYSALFKSPDDIKYCRADELSDMGTFSSSIPFPKIISPHYTPAKFKATFGCFPEIRRFYSTIDNKLFLWSTGSKEPEQIEEEATVICCAGLCGVDQYLLDFSPDTRYTLVVATPEYIKIYKVSGPQIDFSEFFLTEIKFAPSSIAAGPCGQIFVGADCGRIFLIKFDSTGIFKATSIAYSYSPTDWTYGIFPRLLSALVGYTSPSIVQMVFDSTYSYIAAIDDKSHLRFFNYEINSNNCTILSFENSDKYEIASVCAAPTMDIQLPQFIAFCKDGTRLLIERSTSLKKLGSGLTFTVVSQKPPPLEFGKDEVACAQSFMGLTIMVGKKRVVLLRGQRYKDGKNKLHCEYVSSQKLSGIGISIGVTNSDPSWTDPLIWQHHREPPIVYILTSSGGYQYRFSTPSEQLSRLAISSRGFINDEVDDYFSNSCQKYEPVANAILASFQHPECDEWLIYMITQYSFKKSTSSIQKFYNYRENDTDDNQNNYDNVAGVNGNFGNDENHIFVKPSKIIKGIIVRIARILEPLWEFKLFYSYTSKKNYMKWRLDPIFAEISPILIIQLEHTKQWMLKYMKNLTSNTRMIVSKTSTLILREQNSIQILTSFITNVIQILSFLGFLSQQKKQLITELMRFYETDKEKTTQFRYFTEFQIGDCLIYFDGFLDALRDFARLIFTKVEPSVELVKFAHQLIDNCSSLSIIPNSKFQLSEVINAKLIALEDLPIQETKSQLQSIVNSLIEYAQYINIDSLRNLISKLVIMDGIPQAVSIIEAMIKAIDPSNRAIQYYKHNFDERFTIGAKLYNQIFDFLVLPLSIIQNAPKGLDYLMKSKMEIIHVYIFFDLLDSNPKRLVSLNSPYVIDFITNYKKDLLWKYALLHKDDGRVYKEIKDRFSYTQRDENITNEAELNEKIQMLQIALLYARNNNASMDEIEQICQSIDRIKELKKRFYSNLQNISIEEEKELREWFNEFDENGDGFLDRDELLLFFQGDQKKVDDLFDQFEDENGNSYKTLTFEDIMFGMKLIRYWPLFESLLDRNDSTQSLDIRRLEEFYKKAGLKLNIPLDQYIRKHDSNADGKLSFYEATRYIGE